MKVCTHAGLSRREKRLWIPCKNPLSGPLELMDGDGLRESGDAGGESGGAGRRVWDRVFRPDSSMYGDMEERRLPSFRASSSFSSSSISTSRISWLTPCDGGIAYPSRSILAPKTKKSTAASRFVKRFGINVGTACPSTALRMVMARRAVRAAEKTTNRGCFIAIKAAIRNVLSPISENMIIVRESTKECSGCKMDAEVMAGSVGKFGAYGLNMARGSVLGREAGTG